jgi:hypothetical protein
MTATSEAMWRPYEDGPLFVPEMMLRDEVLAPEDAERLTRYLAALVTRRGVVHVAAAFNAVYFGYDLSFGGYVGGPIEFDHFPKVAFGDNTDALPVGAMVNVATGADPLYAEVVYKEGAHPALGDNGDLPGWLSGAPAGARGPGLPPEPDDHPVLTERLVVDVGAFGAGTVATAEQFDRLRLKGRWLDADGHLLLQSRYPSAADAEMSDRAFYSRYLLTTGRDQLLAGPLPLLLTDDAGEPQLAAAVDVALDTVAAVLAAIPSLRMWRDYAFARASLGRRLADAGPLGGADLGALAAAIARVGPSGRRRFALPGPSVRHTAVGPLLRTVNGAASQLVGLGYPQVVCHANTVIGDYARRDADEVGRLPSGAHLRLDDPWQGGGVWQATAPPGPHATVDPLVPYGLGWLDSQPPPPPELDTAEGTGDVDTEPDLLSVTDSHLSWTVTLRLAHTLTGVSPLPERVVNELAAAGHADRPLRLMLTHDGYDLEPTDAVQAVSVGHVQGRMRLTGVTWPLEFFPGIALTFTWQRGAVVLHACSKLLETPVTIDGIDYEHCYDPAVLTRDAAPGCVRRGHGERGPLSLRERVLNAIRRIGKLDMDGVAVLPRDRLADIVYGVQGSPAGNEALGPVVSELVALGELSVEAASRTGSVLRWPADHNGERIEVLVWRPRVLLHPARHRQAEDDGAGTTPADLAHYVQLHTVAPFLRRLHPGSQAGDQARAEYRRLLARFGRAGELPAGYTLVREHTRGRSHKAITPATVPNPAIRADQRREG